VAGESWKTKNKSNTEKFTAKNKISELSNHTAPFGPLFFFLLKSMVYKFCSAHTHTDFVGLPSQIQCSLISSSFLIQLHKLTFFLNRFSFVYSFPSVLAVQAEGLKDDKEHKFT
jgi:hypothetical protein